MNRPLGGILIGLVGAAVYGLAVELWPSSVAVILSLCAMALAGGPLSGVVFTDVASLWTGIFCLWVRYSTLMALTAANLAFPLPANLTLGVIMICGQAASHALAMTLRATARRASGGELSLALVLGLAPAALLGIPGLAGLVAAILTRLGFGAYLNRSPPPESRNAAASVQQLAEAAFYLGALATWKYV